MEDARKETHCIETITRSSSSESEESEEPEESLSLKESLLDNIVVVVDDEDVDGLMNEKWVACWLLGVDGLRKRRLPRR